MAFRSHEFDVLKQYLPDNTFDDVMYYIEHYKVHLILTRDRKSILGYFKPGIRGKQHVISVNASLNSYHFLITFIHELAHLVNYINHGRRVMPHGKEWKDAFAMLLSKFTVKNCFPYDVENALINSMNDLAASTCSDPNLFRVLHKYDKKEGVLLVENIGIQNVFKTHEGKKYIVIAKRRTRFECEELISKKKYLFPGIYEVVPE